MLNSFSLREPTALAALFNTVSVKSVSSVYKQKYDVLNQLLRISLLKQTYAIIDNS